MTEAREAAVGEWPRAGAVIYAKDVDRLAGFYSQVLGLIPVERQGDHTVLESLWFQLVLLQVPAAIAASIAISSPPTRRSDTAIKPVFFVPSIARVRAEVEACGGVMNPERTQWSFRGATVCDGLDPEGNVLQFRESAGEPR